MIPLIKLLILSLLLFSGIVVGFFNYWRLQFPFKYLIWLLFLVLITEIGAEVLSHYGFKKSPIFILYCIIHYPFFSFIYYQFLSKNKALKVYLIVTACLFYVFVVFNLIYLQPISIFPSNIVLIESVFILPQILYLFYDMLHHPIEKPLIQQGMFWVNSGSLFFYSTTFILLGVFNYFKKNHVDLDWTFITLWLTNIIMYSCYLIAIIVERKNKTS